jgi:lysophospholipase L1-like esterase
VAARRLLIVGNSVSMPPQAGTEAYPGRLFRMLGDEWQVSLIIKSGATVEEMEQDVLDALRARPDAVVLQVGINDCAPRPLGPAGRARLGALEPRWLRDRMIGAIHRWRPQIIRLRPLAQFTTIDRFAAAVTRIARAARDAGAAVLLLPITEVTDAAEARTPFTNREIARYNDALRGVAGEGVAWVDASVLLPGLTPSQYSHTPETVHWSAAAHQRVAEYVGEWVRSARAQAAHGRETRQS